MQLVITPVCGVLLKRKFLVKRQKRRQHFGLIIKFSTKVMERFFPQYFHSSKCETLLLTFYICFNESRIGWCCCYIGIQRQWTVHIRRSWATRILILKNVQDFLNQSVSENHGLDKLKLFNKLDLCSLFPDMNNVAEKKDLLMKLTQEETFNFICYLIKPFVY